MAREKRLIDSGVIALGIISLTTKKEKKYYRTDDKADICTIPPNDVPAIQTEKRADDGKE